MISLQPGKIMKQSAVIHRLVILGNSLCRLHSPTTSCLIAFERVRSLLHHRNKGVDRHGNSTYDSYIVQLGFSVQPLFMARLAKLDE